MLVYPAYLTAGDRLAPEIRVDAQTPPMFLTDTADDPVNPDNSIVLFRGAAAGQGAGRIARLRRRRPRLRASPQRESLLHLAAAVCRVDEESGDFGRRAVR